MAIEGRLRELALSDVLQLLEMSRKTGSLTVQSDLRERPAVIRFDRGAICGAEIPAQEGRLGQLLLRAGKITELDMERVLRAQRTHPGVPFGALAVQLGVTKAADVKRQLAYQVEETVYEIFRWKDGYFRFDETESPGEGLVSVRVSTQSLLMEAARRSDEWTTFANRIPHTGVVPVLDETVEEPSAPLDLRPHEWEVLAEIDGERNLKQIALELGRSDFEVARTVFGLLATHVVTLIETPAEVATPTDAPVELQDAAARIEADLSEGRLDEARARADELLREFQQYPEAHLQAGRVQSALGRWIAAAESFAAAVRLDPLSASAYYELGFAAARGGDLRRAEHAWSTYLRLPEARGAGGPVVRRALEAAAALRTVLETENG